MNIDEIILIPVPKYLKYHDGYFHLHTGDKIALPFEDKDDLFSLVRNFKDQIKKIVNLNWEIIINAHDGQKRALILEKKINLCSEGYILTITPERIKVQYRDLAGAFYGLITLKQLIKQCGKILPCLEIEDAPDYKARGIMLDIGRNKIPTLDTLFKLVDFMAELKLNQLQLYIEGYPFAYPSFSEIWKDTTPITGEEILELDAHCRKNFIELVPNQNSFGHMSPWLIKKEFNHLAECPFGYELWGGHKPPGTLNPQNPESIRFIERLYDDLLPYFSSNLFNTGCDETFELGLGKSKELCEKVGKGKVYLDFLLKIYELVKIRGKTMMFWGDIINQHPELIAELPEDIIALEWGYEGDHPFDEHGERYKRNNIPFYVCPGTSTWNSITGRIQNMKKNLLNAAVNGKKHGAIGFLITDWGDNGHWQYLPFSYAGFVYGAALSWNVEKNKEIDLALYLDRFVFEDRKRMMGRIALDLGNYYLKEKKLTFNGTSIARILYVPLEEMGVMAELTEIQLNNVKQYVENFLTPLSDAEMLCKDALIIEAEFRNAIRFIIHGANLGILKLKLKNNDLNNQIENLVKQLIDEISILISTHRKLWLKRNKMADLNDSISRLVRLKSEYLKLYNKLSGKNNNYTNGD